MSLNKLNSKDLRTYSVPEKPCLTCPFEGRKPIKLSHKRYAELINNLDYRGQHLCHSANNEKICRGGRNIQLRILCARGLLAEPTDEAFNRAVNKAMGDDA